MSSTVTTLLGKGEVCGGGVGWGGGGKLVALFFFDLWLVSYHGLFALPLGVIDRL